jgi:molybdopterin molybdotransferase
MRCIISREEGKYVVTTTGAQGSGILMSMVKANGLIVVPEEKTTLPAGDIVKVYIMNRDFELSETPHAH